MFKLAKKKNVIIGLVGMIIAGILTAVFIGLSPTGNITAIPVAGVILRILGLLFLSATMSFLFYIFAGLKASLPIFGMFTLFIGLRVLLEFTAETAPSMGLFIIALLGMTLLIIGAYSQYKTNKVALNGEAALSNKEKQQQAALAKATELALQEDAALKKEIGYLRNSIFVGAQWGGTLYQVIKTAAGFHFHAAGNIFTGLDQTKLIKDFTNPPTLVDAKKDFVIEHAAIANLSAVLKENYQTVDFGRLKITLTNGKSKKFVLINLFEEQELPLFFGNQITVTNKITKLDDNAGELSDDKKAKLNKLNQFFFGFSLLAAVCFGVYFSCYQYVVYKIFTALCIIICVTPLAMYFFLPQHLSLKDQHRGEAPIINGKLNIVGKVIVFPALFMVLSLFDNYLFAAYDFGRLLIFGLILFIVLLAIFFIFTKEYKTQKSVIVVIVMVCLFLSPAVVHKIDLAYDFHAPETVECEIIDRPTWRNNSNETTYYLTFRYHDRDVKTEVSPTTYAKYQIGDEITVVKIHGGLGIEKLLLRE